MSLVSRSTHDVPNAGGTVDLRYPLGDKPSVAPSTLGINLVAFNAAAINLLNLPFGVAVDFNYRQYLTGTAASTATITVNAASGALGNWVLDGSGNGPSNNCGLAGSGSLFVSATDNAGTTVNFPVESWSVQSNGQSGGVKYHGHLLSCGTWFDNQYINGNEGPAISAAFPTFSVNLYYGYLELVLTWAAIEAVQGDVSAGMAIVNKYLAQIRAANVNRPANKKLRMVVKCWHKQFYPSGGGSTTDTRAWPAYVIGHGNWILLVTDPSSGTQQNQIDYTNSAAVAAFTAMHQNFLSQLDPIAEVEFYGLQDESTAVTGTAANGLTGAQYQTIWTNMHNACLASAPHTLIWKTVNWMPPGGAAEVAFFNTMYATDAANNPGRFCYGGPDPSVRNTTAQTTFRGANTGSKDWRGQLIWVDHTEEAFLGTSATAVSYTPAQLVQNAVTVQGANYILGNYENWEKYKAADWLAAFQGISGIATTNLPSLGGPYNTTP